MLHVVESVDGEGRRNSDDDDVVMQQQLLPVKSVVGTAFYLSIFYNVSQSY